MCVDIYELFISLVNMYVRINSHYSFSTMSLFKYIAPFFIDPLLDWYDLSLQFLDIFTPLQIQCHVDSLHWCAGGLERAANLLLQDAVESLTHSHSTS